MAKSTAQSAPTITPTASQTIERQLAQAALKKKAAGKKPTSQELAALRRLEKETEDRRRWEYYATIPLKHWRELCGRQTNQIKQQADLYGAPTAEATIDLGKFLRWFYKFLADNGRKLLADDSEDPFAAGGDSPALERWREEKHLLTRMDRQEREKSLLPRDAVHDSLAAMAGILRGLGDTLGRQFGPEAHELLDESLDDVAREIENLLTPETDD